MGIPRWLTTANLLGIVLAFTLAIPFGARASHHPAPSNLQVFGRPVINPLYAPTAAKLRWTDSAIGVTEYALQRSPVPGFNPPDPDDLKEWRIAKNTFEFWDETFTRVGTFYYRIWSYVGADRSSVPSNTATLVNNSGLGLPSGSPPVPTELVVASEGSAVRFSWKDNSGNESFFRVERAVADQGQSLTWLWRGNVPAVSSTGSRTSFLDLDAGAAPTYRVTVFNGKGAARSYAQACPQCVPGVDTAGVVSMINNVSSNIPGITSATAIASPIVSQATGLTSAIAPSGIQSTVNNVASAANVLASNLLTNVPAPSGLVNSVNAIASNATAAASNLASFATALASPVTSLASNPTGALPPTDLWKVWFGLRFGGTFYLPSVWIFPTSCLTSTCNPPAANDPDLFCSPLGGGVEFCRILVTPLSRP